MSEQREGETERSAAYMHMFSQLAWLAVARGVAARSEIAMWLIWLWKTSLVGCNLPLAGI